MKGGRVSWGWKRIPRKPGGDFRLGSTLAEKSERKAGGVFRFELQTSFADQPGSFLEVWLVALGNRQKHEEKRTLQIDLAETASKRKQRQKIPKTELERVPGIRQQKTTFSERPFGEGKSSDRKGPHLSCSRSPQRQKPPMMVLGPFWFGGGVPSHSFSRNWTSQTSI